MEEHYQVLEEIGHGAFGKIHKVKRLRDQLVSAPRTKLPRTLPIWQAY